MKTPNRLTSVLLIAAGWLSVVTYSLQAPVPLRALSVIGFCAICPGAALLRLLRHSQEPDPLERAVLAVAVSLGLLTLVSVVMALSHFWRPGVILMMLSILTTAAVVVDARRRAVLDAPADPPLEGTAP